jgi:uncharacterized protein
VLGSVPAPLGRFVVPGNHDKSVRRRGTFARAATLGLTDLTNAGVPVRYNGSSLYVAGLDDLGQGQPSIEKALEGRAGEPVLLLTHNPDAIVEAVPPHVDTWLTLAGHLHGGQVRLPVVGAPILPTKYPEHFDHGWASPNGRITYVTRGAGESGLPMRLGCRPEICVFTVV